MDNRSRSITRIGPPAHGYTGNSPRIEYDRPVDPRAHRSRSLDLRRAFDDDDYDLDRNRSSQALALPPRRAYDYDRDLQLDVRDRGGGYDRSRYQENSGYFDRTSPRGRQLARSQEWYPSRDVGRYDQQSPRQQRYRSEQQRSGPPPQGVSPKSIASSKKHNLNVNVDYNKNGKDSKGSGKLFGFGGRKDESSPRSANYQPPRDDYARPDARRFDGAHEAYAGGAAVSGGAAAGGGHRGHHQSYYHESYSRGGGGGAAFGGGRGKFGPGGVPHRQHYKVHCCCFTFTWPPWSYEPVEPPAQIYRNI